MRYIKILIILYCAVFSLNASDKISFLHIGLEQGLSHSTVVDIAQDRQGVMWFATYNGLNRYDGYNFTVYHNDDTDSLSIGSDIIRALHADDDCNIWIGTNRGLSMYNSEQDIFRNYDCIVNGMARNVWDIAGIDNDRLLLATDTGLFVFDKCNGSFVKSGFTEDLKGIRPRTIEIYDSSIYIGAYEGLFVYSMQDKSLRTILSGDYSLHMILSILKDSGSTLWVGTEGTGLYKVDLKTGDYKIYRAGNKGLSSDYIRSLSLDMSGNLWVGTLTSLNIYDERKDSFSVYDSSAVREGSISHISVRSIYKDVQGGMWVGTYFGGLNYYHPLRQRFNNIKNVPFHNSLSDNVVSSIVEDNANNLWIGTNNGGLNMYNTTKDEFTHYTEQDGLPSNDIKAVYFDEKRNKVYVGAHASCFLSVLDGKSKRIRNYVLDEKLQTGRGIYRILQDSSGELLLGATTGSVVAFHPDKETFRRIYFENGHLFEKRIISMIIDSRKRIWIGTYEGLRVYNRYGDTLSVCNVSPFSDELGKTIVNEIYEDSKGDFWIGTRKGVFHISEKNNTMDHYTVNQGLSDNVVHGILEDEQGNLWLSTENGLSCFSPATRSFRNFTDTDGIQSNQFTSYAYCKTRNGMMYFGGVNGITYFNPAVFPDNPYIPSVLIADFQIMNRSIHPGDDSGVLEKHISRTKEITLNSEQSMFSIYFSVADYISGMHNIFAYKLEGFDNEWIYSDNTKRSVSYSNLPPGYYRFMIKAANRDGLWNDTPTVLGITVLPAWYATWWARSLYVLLFFIGVALVFRYLWIKKSMKAQIEMERIDKERIKEINEMKLRFFVNISHELRTPLTLIVAPLNEMINQIADKKLLSKLKYVSSSANRLLHLVNQLMDYRRAELGVFKLKVRKICLYNCVLRTYQYYEVLADTSGIDYKLDTNLEDKEVWCDVNYIEMMLNNLLSNAFKYTPKGGQIVLSAMEENGRLLFKVSDSGKGIPVEKQKLVFERFYQIDQEHVGSGIGLSLVKRLVELHHGVISLESEPGKGCVFCLELPSGAESYSAEEISNEMSEEPEGQVYSTNAREMYVMDASDNVENRTGDASEEDDNSEELKSTVLVVEDNDDIRSYLSDGLSSYFNVLKACNGKEALDIMEKEEVNLIVSDVMMPVMDGIKLCKAVKRNIQTCHIPIIMLSAKADIKDQLDGLRIGADDYIAKPFYMAIVITKIRNLLRTCRLAVEHYTKSTEVEPEKIALNSLDEEFLKKAMESVKLHLDDISFSADSFASEMNMSRSTLHLKMKAVTGGSTMDFIRKIRFSEACRLLREGRYSVTEISEMVGFNSPSYFATSFKKYMGCLPSEYAKK